MAKSYNARFVRPKTPPVMRLTPRDIDMVRLAGQYRFINSDQYERLLGASKVHLRHRLKLLWANSYLDRPKIQVDYYKQGGGSDFMIYALTDKGAALLREVDGYSIKPRVSWNAKNKKVTHPFLQHQLMITEFAVHLHQASDDAKHIRLYDDVDLLARLPDERQNKAKPFDLKTRLLLPTGALDITLEPDYVFSLEWLDLDKKGHFFVEIDRGTMSVEAHDLRKSSILRKFVAYQNYWSSKQHPKDFNWLNFRVLFVTTSAQRARNMREALNNYMGTRNSNLFWFTSIDDIANNVLTHEFFDHAGQPQTLMP